MTARRSSALNAGLFYARIPGLFARLLALDQRQPRPEIFRDSFFNGFGVTPPA